MDLPRVIIEHLLSSLSMMNIKVHNEYPFDRLSLENLFGSNCNIIEETVATVLFLHGMVTGWADNGHSILYLSLNNTLDQVNGGAAGEESQLICGSMEVD